ncbi:MAG: TolC family protein [Ignavibacteriales bacterium]|nr:TolC family protein [Ignavibacteriales bacterium]
MILVLTCSTLSAQSQQASDSLLERGTLQNCIRYALVHQPLVQESLVDEEIAEHTIQAKLADWFPQLNLNFNVQHNPQLPVAIVGGVPINQGLANSSNIQFTATQALFNKDVLLASTSANDIRTFAKQRTLSTKVDVVVNISKAYYATLVTDQQIELLEEAILRLEQSSRDAYTKYQGGIVDKTDYMRAQIALNNAKADRQQAGEFLKARIASLKEQMGYPGAAKLELDYDSTQMEREVFFDTSLSVNYDNRIEYQLLQTQMHLQKDNLNYYKWGFIPSLSLYGGYTINYQNSFIDPLFNQRYPYSFVGLQLSFPLFEGGKRIQQIKQARLQLDRFDYDVLSLENSINTQYALALANYKSNLNNYKVLTDNLQLAQDVYRTIQLQYKAGTKSYLEFITAETDLRSAQVNQTNALYQLLVSKLDMQKALGTISY